MRTSATILIVALFSWFIVACPCHHVKLEEDCKTCLLKELRQIAQDVMGYPDEENSWYNSIGCVLGNLSVQVFPATPEEYQQWEAEYRLRQERYEQDLAKAQHVELAAIMALQEG